MASEFTELIIDCADPQRVAAFWAEALGHGVFESEDGDWIEVRGSDLSVPSLIFVPVPEPKTVKNRVHIDLTPTDREQADEVGRLMALGAQRVDVGQGVVCWVVLADPEGNEFCVLQRRDGGLTSPTSTPHALRRTAAALMIDQVVALSANDAE